MLGILIYLVGAVLFFIACAYLKARKSIYPIDNFAVCTLTVMWPFVSAIYLICYVGIGVGKLFDALTNYFSEPE